MLVSLTACGLKLEHNALIDLVVETEKRLDARIGFAAYDYQSGHSTRRYCIERRKGVDLKILNHQGLRNVWLTPRPSIGDITPAF